MSKIIPPMVSSSPPPMDDNLDEDDEDDEFGSFSTADFTYNLDITQPSKPSTNGDWEANVKQCHQFDLDTIHLVEGNKAGETYNDIAHHNGTHSTLDVLPETYLNEEDEEVVEVFPREINEPSSSQEMQQDNTSQDSVASVATDSGLCSASQDSDGTSPLPTVKGFMVSSASNNISQDESSSSDETLVKSSDTDFGGPFPSSSEKPEDIKFDVNVKTLSKHTYILNDSNSIERQLKDSNKQLSEENIEDQFPISINKELTGTRTLDNYNDFSDCRDVRNILTCKPTVSVFCDSYVSDVKVDADKTQFDKVPNIASSDMEVKLLTNSNVNSVSWDIPDEPSRHLSDKPHIGKGFDTGNMGVCYQAPLTAGNNATNSEVNFCDEPHESDDDFADFAFSEAPSLPAASSAPIIKPSGSFGSDDEFADFAFSETPSLPVTLSGSVIKPNESFGFDDEFTDFACSVVPSFPPVVAIEQGGWADESAMQLPPTSTDVNEVDDDFDDFETASFSSATVPTVVDHSQLASRLENVVTTLFPGPVETSEATLLPSGHMVDSNPVWGDLRDVDTSHALTYQWVSSSANKMLLSALGIDTRNILFGSKWNVAVPRFAANLGISPLEPVRAHSPPPLQPTREPIPKPLRLHPEAPSSTGSEATVPDAQFDWNSSGLVNPLDCVEKDGHRPAAGSYRTVNYGQQLMTSTISGGRQGISSEAVKVLESLPNLSFLRTKTLVFPLSGQALTH